MLHATVLSFIISDESEPIKNYLHTKKENPIIIVL